MWHDRPCAPAVEAGMPLMKTSIFGHVGVNQRKIDPKYGCGIIGIGDGAGGMMTVWKSSPRTPSPILDAGQFMVSLPRSW